MLVSVPIMSGKLDYKEIEVVRESDGAWKVFVGRETSRQRANEFAERARGGTDETVAMRLNEGLWKVTVGLKRSKERADRLRDRLCDAGYTDAWKVERSGVAR
jgi:hypothetical protein